MIDERKKAIDRQLAELKSIRTHWEKFRIYTVTTEKIVKLTIRLHQVERKLGQLHTYSDLNIRGLVMRGRL